MLVFVVIQIIKIDWSAYLYFDFVALQLPLFVEVAPIVAVVVFQAFPFHQIKEEITQVGVVGLIFEFEGSTVVQVDGKFYWEMSALNLNWNGHLLLHNLLVLLHLVVGLYRVNSTRTPCHGRYPCTK